MPALVIMIQKGIHIFRGPLCVRQHSVSVHRGFKMYSVFILLLSVIFILCEPAYPICYKRDPFSTFQLCESNEVSKDFHPDNKNFKKISDLRKYYYIEKSEPVTWFEALHKCRKLGGDLINFENEKEFLAVTKSLNKQRHFWIDMTNLSDQKEYKSIVTGQKPSFLKWYEQEPNNKGQNENCAELVTHAMKNKHKKKQWFMNDFECGLRNYFICETKLPTQLTIVVW